MTNKEKIIAFYVLAFLFIITNSYVILKEESFLFNFVPLIIIVFAAMFFALDKVLLLSVLLVPISIPLWRIMPGLDFNVDLPTEPIFVGFLLLIILKQLKDRDFDTKILKHPISIALYFYLGWKLVTVFTSTMPMVSLKSWMASLWFIIPFYFLLTHIFKKQQNINKFFWMYIITLSIVIAITLVKHAPHDFNQRTANFIMNPFFNDHTSYGAVLAMYLPILIGFVANKELKKNLRIVSSFVLAFFVLAIVLSYTRAAWVSLIGALGVYIILRYKINYKLIIASIVLVVGLFFSFQDQILFNLERNEQDSSSDFTEHIKSISNVATDASNLERINRWNCAVRMFKEKPIFGWGPGTYQFNYAPFQFSYEKTIISTNAGDMGNAHSEYLGALSESGLFGMISFIIVGLMIFIKAVQNYIRANSYSLKIITASTICGITTYLLHGLLNNFLDTDKIAVPFWGFTAIIVAVDVYLINDNKTKAAEKEASTISKDTE